MAKKKGKKKDKKKEQSSGQQTLVDDAPASAPASAGDDPFKSKMKEAKANWHTWEKVGETIVGLVREFDVKGSTAFQKPNVRIPKISVLQPTGEVVYVSTGVTSVKNKLKANAEEIQVGRTLIRFEFVAEVDTQKGNPAKSIDIRFLNPGMENYAEAIAHFFPQANNDFFESLEEEEIDSEGQPMVDPEPF